MIPEVTPCPRCGDETDATRIAVEVRSVYDGVCVWQCGACGWSWPRFVEGRRGQMCADWADKANDAAGLVPR